MIFGSSPARIVRNIERHVKNSHAIGRLIVDGVVSRLTGSNNPVPEAGPRVSASDVDEPQTHSEAGEGLPLPVREWGLLSSGDVVAMIDRLEDDAVRAIGRFEESHRRRRLVIEAVRRRLGS